MGNLVIEHPWLPSRAGGWHKPSELGVEDLPEGFEQSESLAEKLGMRSSALGQLARQKNIPPDKLQVLIDHLNDPELQRFLAKKAKEPPPPPPKPVPEFPVRQVSNIDTRTSCAGEEATDAPTRMHECENAWFRMTGTKLTRGLGCESNIQTMPESCSARCRAVLRNAVQVSTGGSRGAVLL